MKMKKVIFGLLFMSLVFMSAGFVTAGHEGKTDGFVCPVFNENSAVGEHNPNAIGIGGGDYSLIPTGEPKTISVSVGATNGDGEGSPGGAHSSPGDTDYTAIWATD
jgi:hypothetical protein